MKTYYKRNLPHYQPKNAVLFITATLKGAIPKEKLKQLKDFRDFEIKNLEAQNLSTEGLQKAITKQKKLYFGKIDDLLDNAKNDVNWFRDEQIAQIWFDALKHFDGIRYKLICSTIMSNHVHFIFYRLDRNLSEILKVLKGYSAYQSNKILRKENKLRKRMIDFGKMKVMIEVLETERSFKI